MFLGFFPFDNPKGYTLAVEIDGKPCQVKIVENEGSAVRRRYIAAHKNVSKEYVGEIDLKDISKVRSLKIYSVLDGKKVCSYSVSGKALRSLKEEYEYNLERSAVEDDMIRIMGWAIGNVPEEIAVYDGDKKIDCQVKRTFRKDVMGYYPELENKCDSGLEVTIPKADYNKLRMTITAQGKAYELKVDTEHVLLGGNLEPKKSLPERVKTYIQYNGWSDTVKHGIEKLKDRNAPGFTYMNFVENFGTTKEELDRQRKVKFEYEPLMSVVVPMYETNQRFLSELIDSMIGQTYSNWELCLGDGSPTDELGSFIAKKYKNEARIIYKHLEKNGGIAENTNAALALAKGDFLVLADHDDTLAYDALFECVDAINKDREIDVLYTDEDKVSMDGKEYFEPSFKPDFSIDYLCSINYICHLFVFSKEVLKKAGDFSKEFDGAQDHDFILRCVEQATKVHHVPKALYHWRSHAQSTAMSAESKLYAFENGVKAVQAHYDRMHIPAKVEQDAFYGAYKTTYLWDEEPLVSIIIPNKDHTDDLDKCIKSIDEKSDYKNIEFIVVENNSTESETFEYYKELEKREDVFIPRFEGKFNFSAINNFGAKYAHGEYFLLLNNDTEIINPSCIREMVTTCMREDVGICGALLYYPDSTIQHSGVVIGIGGIAGHTFVGLERSEPGYMFRAVTNQNLTAVTAACLMTKKSIYQEVGGLTEDFEVAFNDIDYCMKVRAAGYLVVYNPHAELFHYESKSRGYEDTGEKVERFNGEIEKFEKAWPDILKTGDPYYNKNLSLLDGWYRLKEE